MKFKILKWEIEITRKFKFDHRDNKIEFSFALKITEEEYS